MANEQKDPQPYDSLRQLARTLRDRIAALNVQEDARVAMTHPAAYGLAMAITNRQVRLTGITALGVEALRDLAFTLGVADGLTSADLELIMQQREE